VLVVSYDRKGLDQTGAGHFSPIGGYHVGRDLALVLDVARFKYPPHWVETERLFRAMQSVDSATGRARGWMVLRARQRGIALGFSVTCDKEGWKGLAERMDALKDEMKSAADLAALARALSPLVPQVELRTPTLPAHREAIGVARTTLRGLRVHEVVERAVGSEQAEVATLLLLSISDLLTPARRAEIDVLVPEVPAHSQLAAEVGNVRAQLAALWTLAREKSP
jgi:glutathione gamma-glutamylcysteinyltransferase